MCVYSYRKDGIAVMRCSRCKKREAVVFIQSMQGGEKHSEGLCLVCARKMNIPQIKEYMDQMGITDDQLEEYADAMTDLSDNIDSDMFKMGGTNSLPNFFNALFNAAKPTDEQNMTAEEAPGQGADADIPDSVGKGDGKGSKDKKRKFLNSFCTDLTARAKEGKLDRIIGRDKEIARTIQILCRRQKNNPCLIGEPGVGKTAIAEGLAQKIAAGEVPFQLTNKEVFLLDLTALVAGTQFRGQFEGRIKGLINEIKTEGNIILFIDEIHNIVGAGDSEGSTMNTANILKPALSRGELQVIGATTFKEYRKYIEKDSALERRFQPVTVNEPTIEDTVEVLKGIKGYYEEHHRVKISDELLRMCAVLSERYINDRYLPDKAIDLLDEACANRSIRSIELSNEHDMKKKVSDLEKEIKTIEDGDEPDFEALAEKKSLLIREKNELDDLDKKIENINVEDSDLAKVIELWTGIPANKIEETEFKKLAALNSEMKKRIIGQDKAVDLVCEAIKRSRVQLTKRRRPASFIFVGPTGVGKTELVKVINDELFNGTDTLIRLDMTEYMEKFSVSSLIGSPPGYVGYDDAGELTEKVRRHPYSVILFDEIEKAHPDIMNLLLQILDEGHVKDAQGRSINFENTIICMTSNAGSSDKTTGLGFNKTEGDISREKAMKALSEFLRPEFLGRVDEIVVFDPLSKESYAEIAGLMLTEMKDPLSEKGIELKYDKRVPAAIAEKAYGKKFGARDIRSVIRSEIEDKIADIIVESASKPVKTIRISAKKDGIEVSSSSAASDVYKRQVSRYRHLNNQIKIASVHMFGSNFYGYIAILYSQYVLYYKNICTFSTKMNLTK